jgi:hypothetical protein
MKRHSSIFLKFAVVIGIAAIATPALAGPPLLCHPYDIGSGRSLPWNDAAGWTGTRADYKLENLIADTDALLTPSTPVVVRMETLRRAAIYASMDAKVAKQVLSHLNAKVDSAEAAGHPDAFALLDAAYVTEAFRMMSTLGGEFASRAPGLQAAIGNSDGYALISRGIAAKPNDAGLQFAAALIAADKGDRTRYLDHASKARAGAPGDALLTKNLNHVQ